MESASPSTTAASPVSTTKHIRGSSLLLLGRGLSLVVNFAIQVLTVRYLTKTDYGAFAYALSLANLGATVAILGLSKSITRFIPIYQERSEFNKLFGAILLMLGAVTGLGLAIVLAVYGLNDWLRQVFTIDPLARALLLILILLAPLQALDSLFGGMLAIFASPRAIFFRKHLLGPGLKLLVVLLLIVGERNVYFLAGGYVGGSLLAIIVYASISLRLLKTQGLLQHFKFQTIQWPTWEIFGFTLPLLTSDLVTVARGALIVILLEYFRTTADVAVFRAVLPVAGLNTVVLETFTLLFMPAASRLYARQEQAAIDDLYWQTAIWMAVISFPIFIMTFSVAEPLTLILYGQRYADSGNVLAWLSLGYYLNTALGFNGLTLRVFGRVRYLMTVDLIGAVVSVGLSLLLIPAAGALGAAIGFCATLFLQNAFYQMGLRRGAGIHIFQWRYSRVYLTLLLGGVGVLLFQKLATPSVYVSCALAAGVSLLIVGLNRNVLKLEQTFPELRRLPFWNRLLGK